MKYFQLITCNVDHLLASSPSIQFICFLHREHTIGCPFCQTPKKHLKLMNFAYYQFTWQVSSYCRQYFLIANFVEKMAFCPNIKLTNSVMVGIFITLLNTSVNTSWCN